MLTAALCELVIDGLVVLPALGIVPALDGFIVPTVVLAILGILPPAVDGLNVLPVPALPELGMVALLGIPPPAVDGFTVLPVAMLPPGLAMLPRVAPLGAIEAFIVVPEGGELFEAWAETGLPLVELPMGPPPLCVLLDC